MAMLLSAGAQFFDSNGAPVAAGTVSFFETGTETEKAIYSNIGMSVAADNPYSLDASGRIAVNLYGSGQYSVLVKTSGGTTVFSRDTVIGWIDEVNNSNWNGTDLSVANGGTGASTEAGARTNLGVPGLADNNEWSGTNDFTGGLSVGGVAIATYIAANDLATASNAETLTGTESAKAVTPASLQYRLNPAGSIYRNATQGAITTETKIQFNATDVNALLRGAFDTSTNYRYTATTGCRVLAIARIQVTGLDSGDECLMTLKRSGTIVGSCSIRNDSGSNNMTRTLEISKILTLTDAQYLEVYITSDSDGVTVAAGLAYSSLEVVELS